MSSWAALNVEPDEAIEEEVDDTKEIQIEEALKLYQNALKLHSQGPQFYAQAGEAYDALLNSEIFKYPESISDYKRGALQNSEISPIDPLEYAIAPPTVGSLGDFDINDSTSSTLLQTIYLSYKNHGQYALDSLRALLQAPHQDSDDADKLSVETAKRANAALASFADALERDDTDLNLWRQSARLSSALKSYRLVRYCLESVLADDDNRLEVRAEQLGLEETFAQERLRETLRSLEDRMAVAQVPLKKPKKALLKFLKQQSDPYPYLPALPKKLKDLDRTKNPLALCPSRHEIKPDAPTWAAVGNAILRTLIDEGEGTVDLGPGGSVGLSLPSISPEMKATASKDVLPPSEPTKEEGNRVLPTENPDVQMVGNDDQQAEIQSPTIKREGHDGTTNEHVEDQSSIDQRAEKQLMESLEVQSSQPPPESATQQENINPNEQEPKPSVAGGRKRSSASAIPEDQAEHIRAKSRRTRLRESNADSLQTDEVAFDQNKYYEDRLEEYVQADVWMFDIAGSLLSKVGVEDLGTLDDLRKQVPCTSDGKDIASTPVSAKAECVLPRDLRNLIKNWDEAKSQAMLQGDNFSNLQDIQGMGKSGLAIFLEHSRKSARKLGVKPVFSGLDKLTDLVSEVNDGWLNVHDVAFDWLKCLLMPDFGDLSLQEVVSDISQLPDIQSTYTSYQWSDPLKENVGQILVRDNEYLCKRLSQRVEQLEHRVLRNFDTPFEYTLQDLGDVEMIQTIFELHLDKYASINNPKSEIDQETRAMQRDCTARWCIMARTVLTHLMDHTPPGSFQDKITLRHIWASTFFSNMTSDDQREHVLLCLHELKQLLHCVKDPVIGLANNTIMPEISTEAVDQEISKLKSMDFFMKIFNPESEDPVSLIETIEPILEPSSVQFTEDDGPGGTQLAQPTSQILEMGSFLDRGDATLRLFLWKRLQDAYKKIEYSPKVVSCHLRSIEIILKEISSSTYLEEPSEHRQITLLRWLKSLDGILSKTVYTLVHDPDVAYECIDMDHLKSSMSAVAQLTRLLHSFVQYEDSVRVGQISGPDLRGALAKSAENFRDKLREMHVRCWTLQYTLLKEAISQNGELFDAPSEDCIHYLRSVHNALGLRKMCKRSHKQFLKLMKAEIFTADVNEDNELDICQILYDIHGIRLSAVDGLLAEHGCPPEKLDRATATMMIDFVLRQAKKVNIKDLSKSELKGTIDKMQTAIGMTKQSSPLTFNRRVLNAYLKSPLNPPEVFRAVRGVEDLPFISVPTESAVVAQKGWYFLLGYAALTKFRSQKRLSPVPTTELEEAIAWFRQDIEHNTTRWESWYRLAQTYDSKLEEEITWTAEKINNNKTELVTWQRYSIHCYAMAISTAIRYAEPTQETRNLLSDLYTDFGLRLYSSSREPLSMTAFNLQDVTRHYNSEENQQMYEAQPFKEMGLYSVWNLAGYLLRRATIEKPKKWMNHYMLSKCLWKMFSCDESVRGTAKPVALDDLLDSLLDAIDALPQKRDSRSDPIFEPHFKLVSIVHKLVCRKALTPTEGSKTLAATPWARKVPPPEDDAGWKSYMLAVLRNLKTADKSNWHHRMAAKSAHVIYDDDKSATAAAGAKNELTHQIFTKTMTIQVWKPENERPGRHFVYTTRYVYFFVALLDQLDDRANLDQLLRRVRKKQGDFINHTKLWEDVCLAYARVIRRAGNINEGHEESVFKPIGWEEFVTNTGRLEGLSQLSPESPVLLELLRDAVELKKLNNNLMKVSLLEDLIADLYSRLYEVNMPQVLEQANEENKEKMKVDHLLMASDGAADTPTPPTSAPASEAPAPRGRTKGIARRDVQKRAETIVHRKLAPRAPTAKVSAPTEAEPAHAPGQSVASASQQNKDTTRRSTGPGEEAGSGQHSDVPDSLHDSADDESELSEIDDDKLSKLNTERKMLFPNLRDRGTSGDPESEMSGPADRDGGNEATGEIDEEGDREGEADLGEGEGDTIGEDGENEGEEEVDDDIDMAGEGDGDEDNENEHEVGEDEEGTGEPEGDGDGDEPDASYLEGAQDDAEEDEEEPEEEPEPEQPDTVPGETLSDPEPIDI
ncbi:Histone transcription regulator 3 [Aspergillus nanangensis]|uniref:Histone transcription regulator 3 homolog n=1 Tax=Aspergillus nanangensis TaxID=2582783 RepID=A0AAD4CUR7_ASPNN|nr:Histone transcription regulator 3 [Aspergillus nanangensis]